MKSTCGEQVKREKTRLNRFEIVLQHSGGQNSFETVKLLKMTENSQLNPIVKIDGNPKPKRRPRNLGRTPNNEPTQMKTASVSVAVSVSVFVLLSSIVSRSMSMFLCVSVYVYVHVYVCVFLPFAANPVPTKQNN